MAKIFQVPKPVSDAAMRSALASQCLAWQPSSSARSAFVIRELDGQIMQLPSVGVLCPSTGPQSTHWPFRACLVNDGQGFVPAARQMKLPICRVWIRLDACSISPSSPTNAALCAGFLCMATAGKRDHLVGQHFDDGPATGANFELQIRDELPGSSGLQETQPLKGSRQGAGVLRDLSMRTASQAVTNCPHLELHACLPIAPANKTRAGLLCL